MPIKTLPTQLANQIAAGEVVERPSSVVKELIENCLDAGATQIEIDIEKGGHKRIRIRDNGSGIVKQELTLALAPHATSKISTLDDLESIASLGFRGEALASISAVSRLTLTSKPASQSEAWCARAQGRDMQVELEPAAHPDGSTIDVQDLFYNTPARRKFLRAEKTEFQHIDDTLKRIALSRPRTSFVLKHNGKLIKRYTAASKEILQARIAQVCGSAFANGARYAKVEYEGITLTAWVGGQDLMRSSTDMQFSFVNGRAMRDKLLMHAIRQAYDTVYSLVEQPAYVLFLDMSPQDVDVNVHPAKHEVRFHQARQVHDLLCRAVQDALSDAGDGSPPAQNVDVQHDYIRPLKHTNEPMPVTANTAARPQHCGRNVSESKVTRASSGAYQELMTTRESAFIGMGNAGAYSIEGESITWLDAGLLIQKWLENEIDKSSISQPILMPVSVADSKDTLQIQSHLQEMGFKIAKVANKVILKEVPSALRSLPWSQLFAHVLHANANNSHELVTCIRDLLVNSSDEKGLYSNIALSWFLAQNVETQTAIASDKGTNRKLTDLAQWFTDEN